ncbi:MarR family winged helix-turn-helix transcriptional regulator [Tropicimonas marinistellae]|uniref:MarR family winged helix-turn-helix transcriptional regulator n=1 Tax=Tropicimonas marinistellae TaxID=1739787 RepID=UPI00082A1576|nr:MarR family transcriptional regulator [Tropicimonas marinistellae]
MPDVFSLSEFLPYRLAVLSERVSRRLSVVYAERFGLTIPEWRVLVHLSRCQMVSVREIHNCVNLEKPRVSRAVAKLEAAGLVEKVASEADQRLVEISLTEAGRQVLNSIVPEAQALEGRLLAALSAEESALFVAMMERLHGVLDNDPQAPRRSRMDTIPDQPDV